MQRQPQLLHIQASPRKTRSHSLDVARAYIETYESRHGRGSVKTIDLWSTPLPQIDETTIEAKFAVMAARAFTHEQAMAWDRVLAYANEFKRADRLLFSVPMWNRNVPYMLKHYIDLITQPGVLFARTASGYRPLGPDRPTVVIYSSGSDFSSDSPLHPFDFQKPFFNNWLSFVGITQIEQIVVAPTVGNAQIEEVKRAAMKQAAELASR